uniref:Uncharacterized protein n=1 Tax=Timema tahoe TaxID=61484 RepID=A0A7R9IUI3_9NEOP|nr:unnamed protein product [Timema tahoe]
MRYLLHAAGDRKYRIPPLEPLVISELRVDQDSGSRAIGFSFVAKNASLRGMSGVEVNHIRVIRACYNCTCDMFSPTLSPFDQSYIDSALHTSHGNVSVSCSVARGSRAC